MNERARVGGYPPGTRDLPPNTIMYSDQRERRKQWTGPDKPEARSAYQTFISQCMGARTFRVSLRSETTSRDPATLSAMLSHNRSDLDFPLSPLFLLTLACLCFRTHDATAPMTPVLLGLVHETLFDGGDELRKFGLVFAADFGDGESGGGL